MKQSFIFTTVAPCADLIKTHNVGISKPVVGKTKMWKIEFKNKIDTFLA